jgi:ADP-ribose pyrophosphatase YjhB (NUDIX family)
LIIDGNSVLLVERGREPLKGLWSLPGGIVEVGETLEEAIRREVFEETSLLIDTVRIIDVFQRIMKDESGVPEYHYVLIDYLCNVTGGKAAASDDASRVSWFERDQLGRLNLTEGTLPVIEKAFSVAQAGSQSGLAHFS